MLPQSPQLTPARSNLCARVSLLAYGVADASALEPSRVSLVYRGKLTPVPLVS